MRVPKKIIIGGQEVQVKYRKKLVHNGNELLGLCDYNNNIIYLQQGMPKSKKLSIFIHEYWHFVSSVYVFDLSELKTNIFEVATVNLINSLK
uniref:Uncharacterized protein n=1 Tax=viral metagenome TaxID=1070528 RepID=A0A6M3LQR8_9ZZZZ